MRKLKRWLRRGWGERRIAGRRKEIALHLQEFLGLDRQPVLESAGSRGNDSIYRVSDGETVLGVLRLLNPWRDRAASATGLPAIPENAKARIEREWQAYQVGGKAALTPKALWRTTDALLCAYLPWRPLHEKLEAAPERSWDLLCRGTRSVAALHDAGLVHMDVSFANMLADESLENIVFVDFEYAPIPGLPLGAQKLYDHLRLVESTWKFIPPRIRENNKEWLEVFLSYSDVQTRRADHLSLLAPALKRILADSAFSSRLLEILI